MKKYTFILGTLLVVTALSFASFGLAKAVNVQSGMNVVIGQDQKVESTVYAAGNTVDIGAEVFGDVFCAGQTVTVTGTVHGDVICAGQTVTVNGIVTGDVRVAGQTVTIGANVAGSLTAGAQSFTLSPVAQVADDATIGAATATLNGRVGRDIMVGGQTVVLANEVGRDVNGTMNSLQLASGARINGNITYSSNQDLTRVDGAVVNGQVNRSDLPQRAADTSNFLITWLLFWFISMLLTALVAALAFPRVLHTVSQQALSHPWRALLVGFIAHIALPVLAVFMAITFVGVPLAVVTVLVWLLLLVLSWVFFAYLVGRLILRGSRYALLIMLTGATLVLVTGMLPVVGFIVFFLGLWFGTGMVLLELGRRVPKPTYRLPETK